MNSHLEFEFIFCDFKVCIRILFKFTDPAIRRIDTTSIIIDYMESKIRINLVFGGCGHSCGHLGYCLVFYELRLIHATFTDSTTQQTYIIKLKHDSCIDAKKWIRFDYKAQDMNTCRISVLDLENVGITTK